MGKQEQRKRSFLCQYEEIKELGKGGNATVYRVVDKKSKEQVALKFLTNCSKEKKLRFSDEISVMLKITGRVDGVMPILEANKQNYWYTMPVAKNLIEEIENRFSVDFVCTAAIQLAKTLERLHAQKIYHRDLKPANLYYYDNRACIGDFGLVDFPDNKNNLTREDKGLGAIFTIAPEMKRNPKGADGAKADVYSFAKTLWMLLSKDEKGFDGQYNWQDPSYCLHKYEHLKDEYLVEIEKLLKKATDNTPENRPSMTEMKNMLLEWQDARGNFEKIQENEWKFIMDEIYPDIKPEYSTITDIDDIVSVLNIVSKSRAYNHVLLSSGGLDLDSVEKAKEENCICLIMNSTFTIIKPQTLYIAKFNDSRWNYLFLETAQLDHVFSDVEDSEELVEDIPGHYVDATDFVYGVYDYDTGKKLPEGARQIERILRGKFLIVSKRGWYNRIPQTYDGRHNLMNDYELHEYMIWLCTLFNKYLEEGYSEEDILSSKCLNAHPCPQRIKESIIHDMESVEKQPNGVGFVKENFQHWNFKSIINVISNVGDGKLSFVFEFKGVEEHYGIFSDVCWILSNNGNITKKKKGDLNDCWVVNNRTLSIKICSMLNEKLQHLCDGYDINHPKQFYFEVKVMKRENPKHLFTKEEIREAMRKADDRVNNVLVIDEDGYARVISNVEEKSLYPVYHETWCARKNYVGKYSSLSDAEWAYKDSLVCWRDYLEKGTPQYSDYYKSCDVEEMIACITELMKQ